MNLFRRKKPVDGYQTVATLITYEDRTRICMDRNDPSGQMIELPVTVANCRCGWSATMHQHNIIPFRLQVVEHLVDHLCDELGIDKSELDGP